MMKLKGHMKNIIYVFVVLLIIFTSSCASNSDYRRLKLEFEQLKQNTDNQYLELHNDMSMFQKAYNPELQELFSENILAAEKNRVLIGDIKNDIENTSYKINNLLRESENDRALISENLRTSAAQNVVNEFRQLNNEWESTIYELTNLVHSSERAVESSHNAAIRAAKKAGSAERSADYIFASMDRIEKQTRSLSRIRERMKNLEFKIQRISKQLNEIDESKSTSKKGKAIKKK